MHDHTKLRAFELADDLAVLVYRVTARFPREGLYGLILSLLLLRIVTVLDALLRRKRTREVISR